MFLSAVPAHAADAHAVLAVPRQRVETADFRVSGHLVRVDPSGARSSDNISIRAHWFPGVLRVLVEVTSPPAAREHLLLEMRPDGRNSIFAARPGDRAPIPLAFDKWSEGPLGNAFSYEDFLDQQYFWPGQTLVGEEKYGARECDVLKSTPGPEDRTHYAEVKSWLDSRIGFPVYVEKTVKGTGVIKEFTYLGLRHDGGVWSAAQVEVKIRGRSGSTLLLIDRGSPKAHLTLRDFSPELLTRFPK
ncbi:MAG: outer membrane lipoprotein-sorting protein [Terracidiphilus sp.]